MMSFQHDPLMFDDKRLWLLTSKGEAAGIWNLPLRLDSEVYILENAENDSIIFHEMYKIKNELNVEQIACSWKNEEWTKKLRPKWKRRLDLRGITLIDSMLPYAVLNEHANGTYKGLLAEVLNIMMTEANFTVDKVRPEDGLWGSGIVDESTNLTGIVADLANGDADLSSSGLGWTLTRSQVIGFLPVIGYDQIALMESTVNRNCQFSWLDLFGANSYGNIASNNVWICFASFILAFAIVLVKEFRGPMRLLESLLLVLVSLAQKNNDLIDTSAWKSVRMAVFAVNFLTFFGYTFYTSRLTAAFAVKPAPKSLQTFDDVLGQNLRVAVIPGTNAQEFFANANLDSTVAKLYEDIHLIDQNLSQMALSEVISDCNLLMYGVASRVVNDPNLNVIHGFKSNLAAPFSIALRKDSEFAFLFSQLLNRINQFGILDKSAKKWDEIIRGSQSESTLDYGEEHSQGLATFIIPCIVCFAGILSSLVVLVCERSKK